MFSVLKNKHINKTAWDEVVLKSSQSRIYAVSTYLDIFYPEWKGVIWTDPSGKYLAVAPLFEKNYLLFKTCKQPIFIQQSGVFCKPELNQKQFIEDLVLLLKKRYYKVVYCFNVKNSHEEALKTYPNKINYRVDVKKFSLDQLNSNRKRDYKKTNNTNLKFSKEIKGHFSSEEFLHYSSKTKSVKQNHRAHINRMILSNIGSVFTLKDQKNELIAKIGLGIYAESAYYLAPVNFNTKKKGAATRMIVELITYFKSENLKYLDFEGGTVKNMAQFYQGFGSEEETYKALTK